MSVKLTQDLSFSLLNTGNITVVATVDNVNAQNQLVISGAGFYSGVSVVRVVNSVETPIRGATNFPISGASTIAFTDYEAPLDTPVKYRAILDGELTVDSNTVTIVTDGRTFWLKDVILGAFSCKVKVEAMSDVVRPANVLGQFKVINRQNPILVTDVRQGRTGTMTLSAFSTGDIAAILNIINSGNTLLFQAPASANFPDMYFQAGDVTQTWRGTSSALIHSFTVPFTETDAPSGTAFTVAGNNWLLVTQFGTWQDVENKRLTWLDVFETPFSEADASPIFVPDIIDTFSRTVSNGWGVTDDGTAWTNVNGSASDYNVTPGAGSILQSTTGVFKYSLVSPGSAAFNNCNQFVTVKTTGLGSVTGSTVNIVELIARYQDSSNYYRLLAHIQTGGNNVSLYIIRVVGGVTTNLVTSVGSGVTWADNTNYTLKAGVVGGTLSIAFWQGEFENDPGSWIATVNDSSITATGKLGCESNVNTSNGNLPITTFFSKYKATALT